ncbi:MULTISPECIES: YggT family protein [Actinotignum]|uniref:YggT family protein n=2 Tax=Bacillati TaxID=1783272 RepID=A0AAW9HHH0_9ACTO|nr:MULTISPECIES: YggT family protein [Actinotignum]MBS5749058.1 YggT family protein [Actinotignum schaalii]MDE1557734.1 YggT family protein [Actinotignum schaalii]MDE1662897.1 YggT family protein [Actinotignum schaalii]MDK6372699.1 YggT family protein [Actinotignum timonense]MDK6589629.1 YggT family protein [Actinotignum timonense]
MAVFGIILSTLISIYLLVLLARVIIDLVTIAARDWRPSGALLVIVNIVYALTDPILNLVRKIIPPLRLGGIAIDIGFIVVFIVLQILNGIILRIFVS